MDREEFERAEMERLHKVYLLAEAARTIPRRLRKADRQELALDKKRCRRLEHAARSILTGWSEVVDGSSPEKIREEAAAIDWEIWWSAYHTQLLERRATVEEWPIETIADRKIRNRVLTRINGEISFLAYAMRR